MTKSHAANQLELNRFEMAAEHMLASIMLRTANRSNFIEFLPIIHNIRQLCVGAQVVENIFDNHYRP